ncbi:hypothetical protein B4U80_09807 [Leptotrombidium deliense]|uniref:FAM192A/Fyv6 N-terminal domain-containing protein n=1 Tax=Leptotrombidium deliense TaxID=299467 RepID=A0A443SHU8_9ACAR|nr:hypothetical protein B4U80_09807 [Leptotrombidium deliense]
MDDFKPRPSCKEFVSEAQLEERRRKRQEDWEKVRKDGDPLECPEEVYDPRSLFERLQENKRKKDEEFEESKKLKHLIRGLDNDELSFLELVDKSKMEEESQRWKEERAAINEMKSAVVSTHEEQQKLLENLKKSIKSSTQQEKGQRAKSSQAALLQSVVKPKNGRLVAYGTDSSDSENSSNSDNDNSDELQNFKLLPCTRIISSSSKECCRKMN